MIVDKALATWILDRVDNVVTLCRGRVEHRRFLQVRFNVTYIRFRSGIEINSSCGLTSKK